MASLPTAEQIFLSLPEALLILDAKHVIVKVNPAAEHFLGTSAKNLVGRPIKTHLQFADERVGKALNDSEANLAARRMPVTVGGNRSELVDFNIQLLSANPDWRVVSIAPLPIEGPADDTRRPNPNEFSIRAPDILGHEIKNPLAAIKGAAQLLDRSIPAEKKPLTEMIKSEVERIATLLDRMQSLSTTQPAKLEPVNVHSLIDKARQSIETASKDNLKIRDEFDPSLPDVLVDPDAMMQILTNLLANAVDAVKKVDDPNIQVITRYSFGASFSAQGTDQAIRLPIEIIVRDNGEGVPANIENDIFSPFVSTKAEGQGLGLALVRKLINDMHGRIRYERPEESGYTQFIIFLPMAGHG